MANFPDDFYFGTAISAHQTEGDNFANDWWRAEQSGTVPHKSGKAADSYNRYEEDFDLAQKMHNNALRFSLEWSRIEPKRGEFQSAAIEHYRKVISACKKRGLEPFITLHHFTNPSWFADLGGWENARSWRYFARYAEYVLKALGGEARYWVTINEPLIYTSFSYVRGEWPPNKKNILSALFVAGNLVRAHIAAAKVVRKYSPEAKVGIAKNNNYFEAYKNKPLSRILKRFAEYAWNYWFLDKIKDWQDFVGINYYSHKLIHARAGNPKKWFKQNENREVSDSGHEIFPRGIYEVVSAAWRRYKKPIYILENGLADSADKKRPAFLRDHLLWLQKAMGEGADVRGYFHWSLIDNFEWAKGLDERFGLVEVDFATQRRTPRPSFQVYSEICRIREI